MKSIIRILCVLTIVLTADMGQARGDGGFQLVLTLGEGLYSMDGQVYRSPVNIEVIPSWGWAWFRFDLGLCMGMESINIGGSPVGYWNFMFRPGGRVTPPMIPLYFRLAFPLQAYLNDFDWGLMLGLGVDIRIIKLLGIVFEFDTTLSNNLAWGSSGLPFEFRAGVSFHF